MIRIQFIFLICSLLVYLVTGVFGKFSRKERLIYAVTTYVTLVVAVATLLILVGDQPL